MNFKHKYFSLDTDKRSVHDENGKELRLTGNAYRVLVFLCTNKQGTVTDIGGFLDWAKDYDENHLRQYRYKINTIIGHDIVGYQNGIYSLVGDAIEIQKTKENERNTDLLQADGVQSGMNPKGTLMSKKLLILRVISIGVLAVVIAGSIYYIIAKTTKQVANSNQTTIQNASKTKQENDNDIYKDFLQKEGLLSLRFDGLAIEISIDKASFNCPEQKEYDDLDNKNLTEFTVREIERVIELHYTCGYADVLAAEFALGEFNKDISEIFAVLEIINNPDKKALAQKVTDDWREIADLKNEEYAISRLAADIKNDLRVLTLQINQSLISGDYAASERTRFSNQINQSTQKKQEIKYKIDNILTEKNNALVQFRVGVEINNSNSSDSSSTL
jgi:hypothetical protein